MATAVDTSSWGPTGPVIRSPRVSRPIMDPRSLTGNQPLAPTDSGYKPRPAWGPGSIYDPTTQAPGTPAGPDPITMLGQLLASQFGGASPGVSTAPQPVVQQVPAQIQSGGSNANTILGVVVVAGAAFGLWYWWKHRKGA